MSGVGAAQGVRLAELIASLSLATDLGLGLPEEHVLRQTVIASRIARLAGLDDRAQASTFYVSLLAWVGCVADSHELAHWFGDDRQIRADSYTVDKIGMPMMRMMLGHVGAGNSPLRRLTLFGQFLAGGYRDAVDGMVSHCQTTGDIADRLGLDADVRTALAQAFERWDGKGIPGKAAGDQIALTMRVVQIADDAEVFHRMGGTAAVRDLLRTRRGTEFDPAIVDVCLDHLDDVLADVDAVAAWDVVIEGCAPLDRTIPESELDAVLDAVADYADLKSPWYLGHSRAVATLATDAATACGCTAADISTVARAARVHRLGATGVSTSIWNKSSWTSGDRERVRTVPYLTERILSRQPQLAAIGALAAMAHERMDGSGYPRALAGAAIPDLARLLAAADVYQTSAEDRPGRPALSAVDREAALRTEAAEGRLDGRAVQAVLAAAGHRVRRRAAQVAGLTAREVEVLRLLVRGHSNRRIAAQLSITPRTVGAHIEHIFAKAGVSTRGAAAMFALRHGLVDAQTSGDHPM